MVSFGDVNLSEEAVRGQPHNPGAGGWPTIRYFNKETGVDGGSYVKKTDKPMCNELGDEEMMTAMVEDYGKTSLCDALGEGYPGCDEKEKSYIEKMKSKTSDDHSSQLERLETMGGSSMKPELKKWLSKRQKILRQLVSSQSDEL